MMNALVFLACCLLAPQGQPRALLFERRTEPREKALTLLVPRGWSLDGGAFRIRDERQGGALNMVECKFDMAVRSDAAGTVMIRWLPEMLCVDRARAFGNPEGAVFNNALVRTRREASRFLVDVAVPYAHPRARKVALKDRRSVPALADAYRKSVPRELMAFTNMTYEAAMVTVTYEEDGRRYLERLLTVIEDYGPAGGGLWKNRLTMLVRAPEAEFAAWEPVLSVIQNSGDWSLAWIQGELRGQAQRTGIIDRTSRDLQRLDREIADGRRRTQESIQRDQYLTLTTQNDYRNPFTGRVERDTAAWKRRWVNESGHLIFTDDLSYDPNRDPSLKVQGFKLSQGR